MNLFVHRSEFDCVESEMKPYYEENGNECACGCHEHVSGLVRGKPKRFVSGHNLRLVTEKTEIHRRLYLCSGFSEHQRIHASADRVIKTLIDAGVIQFNWDTGEYEAVL